MKIWMRTVNRASGRTVRTEEIPVPAGASDTYIRDTVNAAIRALPATQRMEWGMIADELGTVTIPNLRAPLGYTRTADELAEITGATPVANPGTIVPAHEYGIHIELTCKNHPQLRWMTKNIAPLGCRTIFYRTWRTEECACSGRDLIPTGNTP